ncbi:MAG: DUF1508 domain-containing protein [Candidatus Methanomethylophilaceae archaeon]|jgi:uncharacterized protein YegP (UPF0339 family)|nr:DUF1508 domain-containing protein [Candidatus Methanomethylophilaceae archaeon]
MGKYVIKQKSKDAFFFELVASNGEVIGTSQDYRSLSSAKGGVGSVQRNYYADVEDQTLQDFQPLPRHPKWELYEDDVGEFRFRLKAMNGEVILNSEGYSAKASAKKGIEAVKRNAESEITIEGKE